MIDAKLAELDERLSKTLGKSESPEKLDTDLLQQPDFHGAFR